MTPERWQRAFDRLYQARALDPLNAAYSAELGRHYAWLAWRSGGVAQAARAFRRHSRAAYAEAISRRPSWGYAYANYAEAGLLEGKAGEDVMMALEQAMALAPWETRTQLKSLLVAFALWDRLSDGRRSLAADTLRRALLVGEDADLIIRMAVQNGREKLIEGMLTQARHRQLLDQIVERKDR